MRKIRICMVDKGEEGAACTFAQKLIRIGRAADNDLVVPKPYVSSCHGDIRVNDDGSLTYRDLAATNGSVIRRAGRLIAVTSSTQHRCELRDGDEILFGDTARPIHLRIESPASAREDNDQDDGITHIHLDTVFDISVPEVVKRLSSTFDRDALFALHEYSSSITGNADESSLTRDFAQTVCRLFRNTSQVSVYMRGDEADDFTPVHACNRYGEIDAPPVSRAVRKHVLAKRQALAFSVNEAGFDHSSSLAIAGVRSGLCAPLWNGQEIIGLVQLDRVDDSQQPLEQNDLEVLVVFATQFVLALENARLQSGLRATVEHLTRVQGEMERLAFYDPLTGLSNRRLLRDRLGQAVKSTLRSEQSVSLLYLDLDHFKRVNDSLGHEAGDALLVAVGERLRRCVRDQDTVARIGGDEFAVLLVGVAGPSGTRKVASKILEALRQPILLPGGALVVTTSIGVTMAPEDGTDEQLLFRNADLAMYRAKKKGRNNCQFFTDGMNQAASARLVLENEMRSALEHGQFVQYFQPLLRLQDSHLIGVEALLRWAHPQRGLIVPDAFIDVAEETGLIVPLGDWALASACRDATTLHREGVSGLRVSVNLSARQFIEPALPDRVAQMLAETGLSPEYLDLEITETILMENTRESVDRLRRLKALGVSLSIDDFGTGYSSLSYLRSFPIDTLKLDRSFVQNVPGNVKDSEISAAIIAMAHKLQIKVVAEGVETEAQAAFLRENGCDFAQGYLFSRPLPLPELLQRHRRPG